MGRRRATVNSLPVIPPIYMVLIVVASFEVACLMMSEPYTDLGDDDDDGGPDTNPASDCELQDCLELYQAAQESLQTPVRYDGSRLHAGSSSGTDSRSRCVVLRTFYQCISNMSRSCLGDLTFHSSHRVVQKQMRDSNCSQRGSVFRPAIAIPPISGGGHGSSAGSRDLTCLYPKTSSHQFCSIFGDPHLRTFDGSYHTCRVIGAFPMIDNEFLSIQVTSEPVGSSGSSAVAKVTVVVKQHGDCTDRYITYQAVSPDPLPSTFDNGLTSFGAADSVKLVDVVTGQHIEIMVSHADTLVVLRQVGRHFSIGVRQPADLVSQSASVSSNMQLCVTKCPHVERQSLLMLDMSNSAGMNLEAAAGICRRHSLIDIFLDACVFDLIASTGDRNFTLAAVHALHDFRRLSPASASRLRNRTLFSDHDSSNSVALLQPFVTACYLMAITTVFLCSVCWTPQRFGILTMFIDGLYPYCR